MLWGLALAIAVILLIDQLVYSPAIAWSSKFKFEQTESADVPTSPILHILRNSNALRASFVRKPLEPLSEKLSLYSPSAGNLSSRSVLLSSGLAEAAWFPRGAGCYRRSRLQRRPRCNLPHSIDSAEIRGVLKGAGATFLRVNVSLLIASAWTIPAGVAIGFNPRLARFMQPVTQVAASVPATAFPVLLLAIVQFGGGLGVGSVALMLLGTQWYILFNVIAGASAIPSDLREVSSSFRFGRADAGRIVIPPRHFPLTLVTGLVTASGGAWNASIVAEYFHFMGHVMSTHRLGAQISAATDGGRFDVLLQYGRHGDHGGLYQLPRLAAAISPRRFKYRLET